MRFHLLRCCNSFAKQRILHIIVLKLRNQFDCSRYSTFFTKHCQKKPCGRNYLQQVAILHDLHSGDIEIHRRAALIHCFIISVGDKMTPDRFMTYSWTLEHNHSKNDYYSGPIRMHRKFPQGRKAPPQGERLNRVP